MSPFVSLTFRTWNVGDFYSGDLDMSSIEMRWAFLKMRRLLGEHFLFVRIYFLDFYRVMILADSTARHLSV